MELGRLGQHFWAVLNPVMGEKGSGIPWDPSHGAVRPFPLRGISVPYMRMGCIMNLCWSLQSDGSLFLTLPLLHIVS